MEYNAEYGAEFEASVEGEANHLEDVDAAQVDAEAIANREDVDAAQVDAEDMEVDAEDVDAEDVDSSSEHQAEWDAEEARLADENAAFSQEAAGSTAEPS
jgi:hypothetical protein